MAGEVIGVQGVRITDLPEAEAVVDSNYMILVDEETGRTYKVKREHIKAQKTSELVDDVGFLRAIPDEYMTESEVREFTDAEIAQIDGEIDQIREELNTWTSFKNNGGKINGNINVNDANLNGSLNFSGILNNTGLKTENKKIFDVKRDTGDQIYFGNGSLKMVLDAKEFNAYGAFNCHSGINIPNNSISSIGYTKLTNGLILQWGSVDVSVSEGSHVSTNVTLPIAFPKNIVTCCSSVSWNSTDNSTGWLDNYVSNVGRKALTNINVIVKNVAGSPGTKKLNVGWMALGY